MAEESLTCKGATTAYDVAPDEPAAVKEGLKSAMDKACKSGADQEKISGADQEKIRNSHSKKYPDDQLYPSMQNIV